MKRSTCIELTRAECERALLKVVTRVGAEFRVTEDVQTIEHCRIIDTDSATRAIVDEAKELAGITGICAATCKLLFCQEKTWTGAIVTLTQ